MTQDDEVGDDDWRDRPPPAWTPGEQPSTPPRMPPATPVPAEAPRSGPAVSDDGRFWWDGTRWQAIPPRAAPISASEREGLSVWTIARGVALGIGAVVGALALLVSCNNDNAQEEYLDCLADYSFATDAPCVAP